MVAKRLLHLCVWILLLTLVVIGCRTIIGEARGALGALVSAEQVYFQNPRSNNAYMDIADASEASLKLGIDLSAACDRWAFSVSDASTTGFIARATGRDDTVAEGILVTLHHVRGQQPAWTVSDRPRGRGRHR